MNGRKVEGRKESLGTEGKFMNERKVEGRKESLWTEGKERRERRGTEGKFKDISHNMKITYFI